MKVDQYILEKILPRYVPHLVRFAMSDRSVGNLVGKCLNLV